MSVFFLSDPHLGHKNIHTFRDFVSSSEQNTQLIVTHWRQTVTKRDIVYCLGDVAFNQESLDLVGNLPGRKILIKGNHDDLLSTAAQSQVFEEIHGMLKYKKLWLSHAPIHPDELRGKGNLHGHVHDATVMEPKRFLRKQKPDKRYLNCCVDYVWKNYGKVFLTLDEVKNYFNLGKTSY